MRARTLLPFIALLGAVRLSAQQPAARQPSAYEELQTFSAVLNHIRVNYMDSVTHTQGPMRATNSSCGTTPTSAPPRTISAGSRSF